MQKHEEQSENLEEFQENFLRWERPHFTWATKRYFPIVYDAKELGETPPERANGAVIILPAAPQDDLHWHTMLKAASHYVEAGKNILWHLDLGLFHRLQAPLEQQQQKKSLYIAVDHFLQTVWRPFKEVSIGVCLYRGPLNFSKNFSDINRESTFGQQDCLEFLLHLAAPMMPMMPCILALDAAAEKSSVEIAELLAPLLSTDLCLALANTPMPADMIWKDNHFFSREELSTIGLCIPSRSLSLENKKKIDRILTSLLAKNRPFRLIAEESLTHCWDGLESLIVLPELMSSPLRRTLAGFAAAGGTIIYEE